MMSFLAIVPNSGLLFGMMLLAAIVGGYAARAIRVPRVVGLVLSGLSLRLILTGLLGPEDELRLEESVKPLNAVKDLALGLILFTVGSVFERTRLRATWPRVVRISTVEILFTVVLVTAGCAVASMIGGKLDFVLALMLGAAGIATAPAATVFVLQEYESKGPITDTILGLTAMNNIICIVLFHLIFLGLAASNLLPTEGSVAHHLGLSIALMTLGSVGIGVFLGTLLSILHGKLPVGETLLIFFAVFILLGAGEKWLLVNVGVSYNFLLTAIIIGAIFANVAIDPSALTQSLKTMAAPVLAGFFVMAGFGLHLSELQHIGWVGAIYIFSRFFAKSIGCKLGVKWARDPQAAGDTLGSAMLCQAAVVIGLAAFVEQNAPAEIAKCFTTVVLGSVVVFELIGPLLVKRCVVQGGEVKAVTLIRTGSGRRQEDGILRVTFQSLLKLFPKTATSSVPMKADMTAEHVMRTSVQLIPAESTFDEVLHFIERSTFSHFPVVDHEGHFIGVIHFSDIRDVIYDPSLRTLVTAIDLADPSRAVVPIDIPLNDLMEIFSTENAEVLAVIESDERKRVVGIVEQRDVLKAIHTTRSDTA